MTDNEEEKRQFTINVSNVNTHESTAREKLGGMFGEEQEEVVEEVQEVHEPKIGELLGQVSKKVKVPAAVLIFTLVVGGILLTYMPEKPTSQAVMSENGVEVVETSSRATSTMTYEELLE
ncbi:MAG: hypothetical protein RR490_10000, partial [Niameybacter sp.]